MSKIQLAARHFGDPTHPWAIIVHGLCGNGRNWHSTAEALAASGLYITTLDLRDHGASPWSDRLTYAAMAADVIRYLAPHKDRPFTYIGHSMGGKLGMVLATKYHDKVLQMKNLCIVDIAPRTYHPHYTAALQACLELPLATLTSRAHADSLLADAIPNAAFRSFLLANMIRENDGTYRWGFNLKTIIKYLPEVAANPLWENDIYTGPTLCIGGRQSTYLQPGDTDLPLLRAHFPQVQLQWLDTGHNVHIEDRTGLIRLIQAWIKQK